MITRNDVLKLNEEIKNKTHQLTLNLNSNIKNNYYSRTPIKNMIDELNTKYAQLSFNWNILNGVTNFKVVPEMRKRAEDRVNQLLNELNELLGE